MMYTNRGRRRGRTKVGKGPSLLPTSKLRWRRVEEGPTLLLTDERRRRRVCPSSWHWNEGPRIEIGVNEGRGGALPPPGIETRVLALKLGWTREEEFSWCRNRGERRWREGRSSWHRNWGEREGRVTLPSGAEIRVNKGGGRVVLPPGIKMGWAWTEKGPLVIGYMFIWMKNEPSQAYPFPNFPGVPVWAISHRNWCKQLWRQCMRW